MVAKISTTRHTWDEAVHTYRTYTYVQQALRKYLEVLNNDMFGFANIAAREILDHLFMTYGNIMVVDLENNFQQMLCAWDPQQPVESLFKQIQDCADYSETGSVLIGHPQKINVGYAIKKLQLITF
jgi:hypothetical protein